MSYTDIKNKSQGFTIVELLIVVVVIAILAAITIVSYNGITNRANQSSARSLASNVAKKAELYYADESTTGYPANVAAMGGSDSSKAYFISATGALAAPNSTNGKTNVQYIPCGTGSADTAPTTQALVTSQTGAVINWWDFVNNRVTRVAVAAPLTTATDPAGFTVGQTTGTVGTKNIGCPAS